jgi:ferritin
MLSQTLQNALNDQLQRELFSAYVYLAMAAYSETQNLPGFAHWMRLQSQEELGHAMKVFDYINDRNGSVELQAIDQPPGEFQSPLAMFVQALDHERTVTAAIHQLYELAVGENDYPTQTFLQWFIAEQVEEEKAASQVVERLKLSGGNSAALLLIDRELGARRAVDERAA